MVKLTVHLSKGEKHREKGKVNIILIGFIKKMYVTL